MRARNVVVGYDGSSNARKALDAAIALLAEGGTVHVVTAYDASSALQVNKQLSGLPEEFRAGFDPLSEPEGYLQDAERHLGDQGLQHTGRIVDDNPAKAILDLAQEVDADLVVVGSRGLGRVTRFVRGSVSSRVANHATTSLLIVHED